MKKKFQKIIGLTLIIMGVLFFVIIGSLTIWADLEASLFNSAMRSSEPLTSLNCPSIISSNESGIVSASFSNTSDRIINPKIQTFISDGYVILMQEKIDRLEIEPGGTKSVEVEVTAANAVYNRIILVRMHQFAYGPLPYRNASCGILVINIPFLTGRQFILTFLGFGVIFSGLGLLLWILSAGPFERTGISKPALMIALILIALSISITGLLSWWLLGMLLFVLWFLLAISLICQGVLATNKNQNKNKS